METTERKQPETLIAAVDALGLKYEARFVPFNQSRNAKKATKPSDYSLNWKITLSKNGRQHLVTDYMQGIAHIPGYSQNTRFTSDAWEALKYACESGKTIRRPGSVIPQVKAIPVPALHDVMYSLAMDAGAIDHADFESWASDYGYDVDSREAEKIYKQCLQIALTLRAMIGEDGLNALRDASQDY